MSIQNTMTIPMPVLREFQSASLRKPFVSPKVGMVFLRDCLPIKKKLKKQKEEKKAVLF